MREGSKSMTVCQPMVMMLVWPLHAELTSTIGPGSRKRRIWETGRSFLEEAFMRPSREHWEETPGLSLSCCALLASVSACLDPPSYELSAPMSPPWDDPVTWALALSGPCDAQRDRYSLDDVGDGGWLHLPWRRDGANPPVDLTATRPWRSQSLRLPSEV